MQKSLKWAMKDQDQDAVKFWEEMIRKFDTIDVVIQDYYQVSAFSHPRVIVYENDEPRKPVVSQWGLIPHWAKAPEKIWNNTLNARGETLFEKPAFRMSAESKRCLVPVDGFYDYHEYKGKKYPFYITRKDDEPLYFAGLWNDWADPLTGEIINTYSIVTTRANPMMEKIHNKPKNSNDPRMPVILPENMMEDWLEPLSRKEIQELASFVYPDSQLDSWTVRKLSGKDSPGNVPEANEKYEYKELAFDSNTDLKLF
jgi:putative SOS response-associated peptidase YedK